MTATQRLVIRDFSDTRICTRHKNCGIFFTLSKDQERVFCQHAVPATFVAAYEYMSLQHVNTVSSSCVCVPLRFGPSSSCELYTWETHYPMRMFNQSVLLFFTQQHAARSKRTIHTEFIFRCVHTQEVHIHMYQYPTLVSRLQRDRPVPTFAHFARFLFQTRW